MQTINARQNGNVSQSNGHSEPTPEARDRATLEGELLEAMTSFSPRDRGVLKTWHRHAISLVHLNVLTSLEAEGPLPMKRLAEAMDVSDASATGIVDRMEKRGLVERRHDTADRRVVHVYPTEAGAQVFRDMDAHRRGFLSQVFAELSDPELSALLTGMRAVSTARARVLASMAAPASTTGARSGDTSPPSEPAGPG